MGLRVSSHGSGVPTLATETTFINFPVLGILSRIHRRYVFRTADCRRKAHANQLDGITTGKSQDLLPALPMQCLNTQKTPLNQIFNGVFCVFRRIQ